jgi:hypothetical protein
MPLVMTLAVLSVLVVGLLRLLSADLCSPTFPQSYVVYQLCSNEYIKVDGRLEEEAWLKVAWTRSFVDIQGEDFPVPRFETKVKMRWDETFLYIGAYLQESDVWANQTKHDSIGTQRVVDVNAMMALFNHLPVRL